MEKINLYNKIILKIKYLLHSNKSGKKSYSQCGEDLIVNFIFSVLGIKNVSYLDIGAFDPHNMNNTFIFYRSGGCGINIEPNPKLFSKFKKYRKNDINLNIGVSDEEGKSNYYMFDAPALNTFSEEAARKLEKETKHIIQDTKKIEVKTIREIVNQYNKNIFPDFLSIDTEGSEEAILKSIDYNNGPKVICVESISYSENNDGQKDQEVKNFLEKKGYMLFADTYINSIFVKKDLWLKKKA